MDRPNAFLPAEKQALVERLTADILAEGPYHDLAGFFAAHNAPPPYMSWFPAEHDLADTPLPFLLDYWKGKRAGEALPHAAKIDPLEMKPALGIIMLLDVLEDGWDYRYRVYGSQIAARLGRDLTGWRTSDIARHAHTGDFFLASYRAVIQRRRPLFTRNASPTYVEVKDWSRLILPLIDTDGRIVRLLVGNVPGDWQPAERPRPYG